MGRTVIVCDTDLSRITRLSKTLAAPLHSAGLELHAVNDMGCLKSHVSELAVEILFLDARIIRSWDEAKMTLSDLAHGNPSLQVVFTGVSEQNLVEAEQLVHAFLLPVTASEQEVICALDKAMSLHAKLQERPIVVRAQRRCRTIYPNKVSYIESDLRKIRIHMNGGTLEVYGKLSNMLSKLPARFVQCHKSFVVNMGYVMELGADCVVLTTGERVPVSQKRRKHTREAFVSYVGRVC